MTSRKSATKMLTSLKGIAQWSDGSHEVDPVSDDNITRQKLTKESLQDLTDYTAHYGGARHAQESNTTLDRSGLLPTRNSSNLYPIIQGSSVPAETDGRITRIMGPSSRPTSIISVQDLNGTARFTCPMCGATSFLNKEKLGIHVKNVHVGVKLPELRGGSIKVPTSSGSIQFMNAGLTYAKATLQTTVHGITHATIRSRTKSLSGNNSPDAVASRSETGQRHSSFRKSEDTMDILDQDFSRELSFARVDSNDAQFAEGQQRPSCTEEKSVDSSSSGDFDTETAPTDMSVESYFPRSLLQPDV